jgi:hypothetical protein
MEIDGEKKSKEDEAFERVRNLWEQLKQIREKRQEVQSITEVMKEKVAVLQQIKNRILEVKKARISGRESFFSTFIPVGEVNLFFSRSKSAEAMGERLQLISAIVPQFVESRNSLKSTHLRSSDNVNGEQSNHGKLSLQRPGASIALINEGVEKLPGIGRVVTDDI